MESDQFSEWIHGIHLLLHHELSNASLHEVIPTLGEEIPIVIVQRKPITKGAALWHSPLHTIGSPPSFTLYHATEPGSYILDIVCEGRGRFLYRDTEIQVYWEQEGTGFAHYFHSYGLAFWFEKHDTPCLHANSLVINGHGVGLMAASRAGKSTLTAALVQQGHGPFADDMLPLRLINSQWVIFPSLPAIRLWPDSAKNFTTEQVVSNAQRVHEKFEKRVMQLGDNANGSHSVVEAVPLKAVYLLERSMAAEQRPIQIHTLSPSERLIALLKNSLIGGAAGALGIEASRLKKLACFAKQIPIKRLCYPSGFDQLDKVCELLEHDIVN